MRLMGPGYNKAMKRWIIRSFFIGLLLLFVGGWAWSYHTESNINYGGRNFWEATCNWGNFSLGWISYNNRHDGWEVFTNPARDWNVTGGSWVAFDTVNEPNKKSVIIPFWLPTILLATLLWLVCRKTRPKINPRKAFPVEITKQSEKP